MSSPALIASFTIDQLKIPPSPTGPPPWPSLDNLHLPSNSGRGLITAKIIRSLMSHYDSVIKPRYPLPLTLYEKPSDEFTSLDQGPLMPKFSILVTCAISAAHRGHYETEWLSISRKCRDWAGEISKLICALPSQDAMAATVSLLVYELAEPSRGLLWDLYDSSIRLCLELGWHCFQNADDRPSRQEPFILSNSDPALSPRFQIVSLLESLHR
ncbi:hypothetical protein N7528_005666 [Penicillium herquei]|nr:hypothetical protein N7528_005666 [Penicillium herquei]